MPAQETFLERTTEGGQIRVLKTYDGTLAREAFGCMNDDALEVLAASLKLSEEFNADDIPPVDDPDFEDLVWDSVLDQSREYGSQTSFFVVCRELNGKQNFLFVSPDWPTAESFALKL